MPNKANLRRWVQALRSGQYQQGTSYMRTEDGKYCCLGVAIDLAIANGVVCEPDWGRTADAPREVNQWYGIDMINAVVKHEAHSLPTSLAVLNDSNFPFDKIADLIEAHYKLLEA